MQACKLVSDEHYPEVIEPSQNPEERMIWAERRATIGVDATMGVRTLKERAHLIRLVRNALMETGL